MKKIITFFAYSVLILFGLSAFGWLVKHATIGDKAFGPSLKKGLDAYVSFLDLFEQSVEEVQKLPETFVQTDRLFEEINLLDEDLWVMHSYSSARGERMVEIRNLRNDSIDHRWLIDNPHQAHDRIMDPLLLPNKSLVYSFNGVTGLTKLDSLGQEIWVQDTIAHHHALNLDSSGKIWACSYTRDFGGRFIIYKGRYEIDSREMVYIDNTISQLDAETGQILFHKSVSEILKENGLDYLIMKSSNIEDPLHLNDVQPALKTTKWYKEGDLFLSLRNCSVLLHYRPSSNQVLQVFEGNFYSQHDIDFLNDSTIIFFNNNAHTFIPVKPDNWHIAEKRIDMGKFYSNVMAYDLSKEEYYPLLDLELFEKNQIFTITEGMQEPLPNGKLWIEEQNDGVLWVFDGDSVIYKNVMESQHPGYHHLSNWTRILPNYDQ